MRNSWRRGKWRLKKVVSVSFLFWISFIKKTQIIFSGRFVYSVFYFYWSWQLQFIILTILTKEFSVLNMLPIGTMAITFFWNRLVSLLWLYGKWLDFSQSQKRSLINVSRLYQGSHSAANAVKAVKMVDFEREAVVAVKFYIFSVFYGKSCITV